MSEPKFPQRVLRAPKAFKPRSNSDFPDYMKPALPVPVPVATTDQKRGIRILTKPRTWMTDLEGRTFGQSIPIIQAHKMTYKIIKVDNMVMAKPQHTHENELFLTLGTDQAFFSEAPELPEILRVSDWIMRNPESVTVMLCEK